MTLESKISAAIKGSIDLIELFEMAIEANQGGSDADLLELLTPDEDETDIDAMALFAIAQAQAEL